MDIGGPDWQGWRFAPYGRAGSWRLIGPDGTNYTAQEVASIPHMALDLDYLRTRLEALQKTQNATEIHVSPSDAAALRHAAEILQRLASPYRGKRRSAGTSPIYYAPNAPHHPKHSPTKKAGGF